LNASSSLFSVLQELVLPSFSIIVLHFITFERALASVGFVLRSVQGI